MILLNKIIFVFYNTSNTSYYIRILITKVIIQTLKMRNLLNSTTSLIPIYLCTDTGSINFINQQIGSLLKYIHMNYLLYVPIAIPIRTKTK